MNHNLQIPTSKHFRLQQLAEGVYAAIYIEGGTAMSNAGIVDLGDYTLIYDTFMTPQAAEDLRLAAETLTGRPVDMVINSHLHYDHIWGNQVFSPNTKIISTEETRRLIISTRGHVNLDGLMADAEANLTAWRTQLQAATEESQRRQFALWVDFFQGIIETKPILQVRAPNLTFTERLLFHGTNRSAELIPFVGGHTQSDAILFLPQEGIAFMSDLLFVENHPYLGGSDIDQLLRILDEISGLNPKLLVPGHGPVGTIDSLAQMTDYVQTLDELARKMVEAGEIEESISTMNIPEPYADWLLASFFAGNMNFLYQRWQGKQ